MGSDLRFGRLGGCCVLLSVYWLLLSFVHEESKKTKVAKIIVCFLSLYGAVGDLGIAKLGC